ncbi:hypothetical protein NB640_11535 [Oxalobacter vibrioformis]|uniref:Uncharacterized protein n=1 Tax=Oxalobacter vibrioformis TaxID=933080 RepID=A0A9E9P5T4_9BURK|nr:hypothetical protein [Oxalobacter vibrioformis]WAW11371.1 hypothetical protein NB640_11535 [Oxalobacter vibrioformis]
MVAFARGKLVRQDGDEDQVVDPQDDFEDYEGDKAYPGCRFHQPFHAQCPFMREKEGGATAHRKPSAGMQGGEVKRNVWLSARRNVRPIAKKYRW